MFFAVNIIYDWKILLGFTFIILVSITNSQVTILPVSSLVFLLTSISLWFISLSATFVCLHKLLQKKEPLQLSKSQKAAGTKPKGQIKPNPEKVKALTREISMYYISKWYSLISHDGDFTEQSRILLEEIITRLAEVQICVSNKLLLHGSLNLFLRHLKEFRRSLRRKEKYGGKTDELYRYSHMCSNSSKRAKDYFLHQLTTNLLRHFINSELWNSLPCSILVSILSKKLTSYLLNIASHPDILNFILLNSLSSEAVKEKYDLQNYARIGITQYFDVIDAPQKDNTKTVEVNKLDYFLKSTIQEEPKQEITNSDVVGIDVMRIDEKVSDKIDKTPIMKKDIVDVVDGQEKMSLKEEKLDHADLKEATPTIHRPLSTDPVKIYEPKITKSNKTWRDSRDLGLGISLGQDPLDVLPMTVENIKSFGKSTFWDTGKIEHFVEDSSAQLINEMKYTTQTTMEGLKSSIKPISDATVNTLHNIKDLQETTVNNALHKIGDFQDEAASMVEGIFDLGKAGLRKGLRLTGLQDNIENAKATLSVGSLQAKSHLKKKLPKTSKIETPEKSIVAEECLDDSVWINPLTMDSPNFDGQILLEKPGNKPRKHVDKEERELQIPFISMEEAHSDTNSPDLEYEDAADLASSIAKLRSLLQQRSSESSMSTPALSPMFIQARYQGVKRFMANDRVPFFGSRPPEDFAQKTAETESISDMDEVDGVMPSFYKFCAKTATGVFDKTIHTIKTALPGTVQDVEYNDNAWIFLQNEHSEVDILVRMKKLLTERKEYCTLDTEIDTAYEAIDNLDGCQQPTFSSFSSIVEFEDELDDFEVKLPITKALIGIFCELLADTDTPFVQEPVIKAVLLGLGGTIENFIISTVDAAMANFCENLLTIPEVSNQNTLYMDLEVYVEAISNSLPDILKLTLGKSTITKAIRLLVSSLQFKKINEDVVLQIFELISMKLIEESSLISPPASA